MQIYNVIFIIIGTIFGITLLARCYICCCLKNKGLVDHASNSIKGMKTLASV